MADGLPGPAGTRVELQLNGKREPQILYLSPVLAPVDRARHRYAVDIRLWGQLHARPPHQRNVRLYDMRITQHRHHRHRSAAATIQRPPSTDVGGDPRNALLFKWIRRRRSDRPT